MDLVIGFWIILFIFAVGLSFVLIKSIFKAIMFSILIITLLLGVAAFFIVNDALDIKENIMLKDKLVVLKEGNNVITAFTFQNMSNTDSAVLKNLNSNDYAMIKNAIKNKDYSIFNDKYYKTIIFEYTSFNKSTYNGLSYDFGDKKISLTQDELRSLFESDNTVELFFNKIGGVNNVDITKLPNDKKEEAINDFMKQMKISSQAEFKNYLFGFMVANMVKTDGPIGVLSKVKSGEIYVYPNTAIFKAIKLIPDFLIKKIADKLEEKISEEK